MIKVKKLVEEIEPQENMEVIVTDKFSIETSVTFWREYFSSRGPRRRRAKPTEAEHVADDGLI
jgi:hypothetical protein